MNEEQRLKLQDMIKVNDAQDNTSKIKQLKHSSLIKADYKNYLELKKKYPKSNNTEFFKKICQNKCQFLNTYYTDIYNRMVKNELNEEIFMQLIDVLGEIEEGKLDQHEASFKVGKLLKELYIDSALRREGPSDKKKTTVKRPPRSNLSYKEFKKTNE